MSSCTPVLNLMAPFIEGKLRSDEERVVRDHIDHCTSCTADFQNSLFLTHLLKENLLFPDPPDDLARSVVRVMHKK